MEFCNGLFRVLSRHPAFWLRSNYTKSNRLRGAPVPNVYLFGARFDEKPALIVRLTVSRFLPARILKFAAAGR